MFRVHPSLIRIVVLVLSWMGCYPVLRGMAQSKAAGSQEDSSLVLILIFLGVLAVCLRLILFQYSQLRLRNQRIQELESESTSLQTQINQRSDVEADLRLREFQMREQAQQLEHEALHDDLTDLPNRALFMDRLQRSLVRMRQYHEHHFAVLFLDLDRFKVINDSLGHVMGDRLLVEISERLKSCLREIDTVARWGVDEFVILVDPLSHHREIIAVTEKILSSLRQPMNLGGQEVFVTSSIGITLSHPNYQTPEDLLRDADTAMYRAKDQGKDCYEIFNREMHIETLGILQLETDLRRAVENLSAASVQKHEFVLHYQPIISLKTQRIEGFEALVRWQHPTRGLLSPALFINLAEERGLISSISHATLKQACQQLKIWKLLFPQQQPLSMNINLSTREFSQPALVATLDQILRETDLNPNDIKLEITENLIMSETAAVQETLSQLRARGFPLCVDDFGTGYSSLSYLDRFPVSILKIDRSFINRMGNNGENTYTIRAIITLARSLNMDVVAEGVEKLEQLIQLKMLQCEKVQGYFYSKPVDAKAATQLLREDQDVPLGERKLAES
ncbi:MAG: EAL domain-containing protein [Synechococcaceae cyanobacterium SM2_3_1]|nr:EAL domain-containing protein [Synechococcaceae cyanobacterium SM2_3_1]